MFALGVWTEWLGHHRLRAFFRLSGTADELVQRLAHAESRRRRDADLLESYWMGVWGCGHLTVLAAPAFRRLLEMKPEREVAEVFIRSVQRFSHGDVTLRAVWATAQAGKLVLPFFKQCWVNALGARDFLDSSLVLTALGKAGSDNERLLVIGRWQKLPAG